MFGNCGFDNTEISAAYSVSTLTPMWYFVMVTQHAIVLSCCSVSQHPWGVSGHKGNFGMVIHVGSKQRNQSQAFRLALYLSLLFSSYISIKASSLNWTVHLMQLFCCFSGSLLMGWKVGLILKGHSSREAHNNSSRIDDRLRKKICRKTLVLVIFCRTCKHFLKS